MGLAGQHEAGVDLGLLERVVAAHVDLAVRHQRPAGAADPALAGERQVGAGRLGGVEDRGVPRHRRGGAQPVEDDGDLAGLAGEHGVGPVQLRRRLVDVEQLEVHALGGHAELGRAPSRASVIIANGPHSQTWSIAASGTSAVEQPAQPVGVEPAGEQLDVARLAGEHVHELEPRAVRVLQVAELLGEHHRAGGAVAVEQRDVARPGWRSTVPAIDSIGVIPDPAAMHRWRPPASRGRRGSARSASAPRSRSPGITSWTSQEEKTPSGISRTPIRGRSPTGGADRVGAALLGAVDRCRRRVSDWPASNA